MPRAKNMPEGFAPFPTNVASEGDLPMILAMLERMAADYYRGCANETDNPVEWAALPACAAGKDPISEFVESLEPEAISRIDELSVRFPQMRATYDSLMGVRNCKRVH